MFRKTGKQSDHHQFYGANEGISRDSGSEEVADMFVALFPSRDDKPSHRPVNPYDMYQQMLTAHPEFASQIHAIAYFFGVSNATADHDSPIAFQRHLMFFNPRQDQHPNPDISAFCTMLSAAVKP